MKKSCGQMGPTPLYSQSQVVSVCRSFRPVAQFLSPAKYNFSIKKEKKLRIEKGCGYIDVLITFPGHTDPKYIYMWVCGLTSIVQV